MWRGLGSARSPGVDVMRWRAMNGESVIVYHLPPDGYEFGSSLPVDAGAAQKRWNELRALLLARSNVGVTLLANGADHHAKQPDLDAAIAAMREVATPDVVVRTSLSGFAKRLLSAVDVHRDAIPEIQGELRNSYGYTWTLNGTFGTRAAQKRANARAERALLRDAEPWAVLAWLHGSAASREVADDASLTLAQMPSLLDMAWRTLLRAHPHDTLCGCSIDDVARAMDGRLASTMTQAAGLRSAALNVALGHNAVAARARPIAEVPMVVIRNRTARWRGGVAELCLDETLRDELVGPLRAETRPAIDEGVVRSPSVAATTLQLGKTNVVRRRRESPQHYPDNDLVRAHYALGWVAPVPPLGISTRAISFAVPNVSGFISSGPLAGSEFANAPQNAAELLQQGNGIELRNGVLSVSINGDGVTITRGNRTIANVLTFETSRDEGDSYTPSIRGEPEPLILRRVRAGARGPLRASAKLTWSTNGRKNRITIATTLILDAESRVLRVDIRGDNCRRHHRLRMHFATGISDAETKREVWADAAFGPVLRTPINVPLADQSREHVPPTMPMHRWVTVSNEQNGATLHSDGLAEVETRADGTIALTLLRAIGQLSRNDLPERTGHAGWPANIPLAQSLGTLRARMALHLHDAWSNTTRDEIEMASDNLLLPLTGETWRDLNQSERDVAGPELRGEGLRWSTVTLADDSDGITLRCTNDSSSTQPGAWILPAGDWECARTRLDETLLEPWRACNGSIEISVPPLDVLTLGVRRRVR